MYRILAADQPVRERRNQREHPQYTKPELVATAPNQTCLGHHQAVADQVDVLLPLRRARHLQPLRGRLDGRRPGELGAGRSSHRRDLRASSPRCALRPRRADASKCTAQLLADLGVTRTEPPSGVRRQPLLRGFKRSTTPASLAASTTSPPRSPSAERSSLGTTPNIAMAGSRCSPTSITIELLEQRGQTLQAAWTRHPERFVRGIPQPHRRLDQPTCDTHNRRNCSEITIVSKSLTGSAVASAFHPHPRARRRGPLRDSRTSWRS